jgi:hypothetical protein
MPLRNHWKGAKPVSINSDPTKRREYMAEWRAEHRAERRAAQHAYIVEHANHCAGCGQAISPKARLCTVCAGKARAQALKRKRLVRQQARQALVWLAQYEHVELRYQGRTIRVVLSQREALKGE